VRLKYRPVWISSTRTAAPGTFTVASERTRVCPSTSNCDDLPHGVVKCPGRDDLSGRHGHWLLHDDVGAHVDQRHILDDVLRVTGATTDGRIERGIAVICQLESLPP